MRKMIGGKKKYIWAAAVCFCIAAAGWAVIQWIGSQRAEAAWAERIAQGEARRAERAAAAESAAAKSGEMLDSLVGSGVHVLETVESRPRQVELTKENTNAFVTVDSCLVSNKTSNILLQASSDGVPVSDDDYYYLFALRIHHNGIEEGMAPIIERYKGEHVEFQFSRHFGSISGFLYKYVIAVKIDGEYVAVSDPCYVTNPEEIAVYKSNGSSPPTKKGLLIDPDKLLSPELEDLEIKHAAYNIPMSRILGESTSEEYPTIEYPYNGKGYKFNGEVISEYDLVFRTLTEQGIEITVILLNDVADTYLQMIHPLSRSGIGSAPYYAFNASDEEGAEYLAAISAFLAERYSGRANGRGVVSNWIIGNEINARESWNYMERIGLKEYVREYERAFRIFYNTIKGVNSASRVYLSLDQGWNSNSGYGSYDAKDILDEFNRQIKTGGNIDWGLAIHPYNVPLTSPYTWEESRYVTDTEDTPMVTMANIRVVTDYLEKEEFLDRNGEVRSVTISELGYTSTDGEEVQAAAIVYAYKVVEADPHIDSVLFSRQTDAAEEMEQGLALGINHVDGTHKYLYKVYKYMDGEQAEKYTDFAKKIIGIDTWEDVVRER